MRRTERLLALFAAGVRGGVSPRRLSIGTRLDARVESALAHEFLKGACVALPSEKVTVSPDTESRGWLRPGTDLARHLSRLGRPMFALCDALCDGVPVVRAVLGDGLGEEQARLERRLRHDRIARQRSGGGRRCGHCVAAAALLMQDWVLAQSIGRSMVIRGRVASRADRPRAPPLVWLPHIRPRTAADYPDMNAIVSYDLCTIYRAHPLQFEREVRWMRCSTKVDRGFAYGTNNPLPRSSTG